MKNDYTFELLDDFNVNDIDVSKNEGRWACTVHDFERSNAKAVKFVCGNSAEKNRCYGSLTSYVKRKHLDWTIYCERNTYNIYLVRA